ncbi:MAG: hypothetical protein Q9217_006180 [Psora testacea]
MASSTATISPATQDLASNITTSRSHNASANMRGGRGSSRGGQHHNSSRGRGKGRGNRENSADRPVPAQRPPQNSYTPSQPAPPRPSPDDLGGGGVSGSGLTRDAAYKKGEEKAMEKQKAHEEDTEAETEAQFLIFTDEANKRYEDFEDADFEQTDETLGIKYTQKDIHADTLLLLRYNCPDNDCDVACRGWPDLHRHVRSVHHKVLCDLCTRNKKVFTHEHDLFIIQELRKHEKFGDDHPGAVDQSGFKGHPECGFCRQRFYGDDELYTHCRDKHERCHICDRRSQGRQQQYYVDYNSLEQHFQSDHFLCADQDCLDKKFVVFESEMDLKAHQLEAHPNGLTKDARRDARRIDISGFDYRAPHQEPRRGRGEREGRGRGRGRDPNTEPLPHSTAQPMRRDELAYQRQMAIRNAQSATARTFGGQLTSPDSYAARPSTRMQDPTTATRTHNITDPSAPAIDSLSLNPTPSTNPQPSQTTTEALTPQQQARQIQHTAIIDRASTLLHHNPSKISSFRDSVSSYRNSTITAAQLIDRFFSLFDVPSSELGKVIKELADVYENEAKRNGLLKAWNDWRAINEDYPSLPGPSGVLPGSSAAAAGSGGHRVLKLKSSTAQSSRSAMSRQGSWGNAGGPSRPLPAISSTGSIARLGTATPWVSSSSSSTSQSLVAPLPASRAPNAGKGNSTQSDAFPALPAAAKPNTMIFGLTRGSVRWDEGRNSNITNPWGAANRSGAGTGTPTTSTITEDEEQDVGRGITNGKKKGKQQGKKQMLYKFG